VTGEGCFCRGCRLRELAGDVAGRVWSLPHQDLSEMVILRRFDAAAYLGDARAPLAPVLIRPGGDRGRAFLRALLGDVALELEAARFRTVSLPRAEAARLVDPASSPERLYLEARR